jgi:RNA polymerase sigma-70 factor (ECF subfamily)
MDAHPLAAALPADIAGERGDRLGALFDAHYARLYRLARRLVANADDAHDLVQETFLRAATARRTIPAGHTSEEAWLVRVLVNLRRDQWRRIARRNRAAPRMHASSPPRHAPDQESALIARAAIWRALDVLPPRRRAVIVLHELEEHTVSEIAALLGITAITVRWHPSVGRRDLARMLDGHRGETR